MEIRTHSLFDEALKLTKNGVEYSQKNGAICPWCGTKNIPIIKTPGQDDNGMWVRFHQCETRSCKFFGDKTPIKSLEKRC